MRTKRTILLTLIVTSVVFCINFGCKKNDSLESAIPPPALKVHFVNVNHDSINKGGSVMISWASNAKSVQLIINDNETFQLDSTGSKTFYPQVTSYFKFTFLGQDGTSSQTESKKVVVSEVIIPPNKPTIKLSAIPDSNHIYYGDSVKIIITATDYNTVSSPDIPGVNGPGTYFISSLTQTTTFHATAQGEGGTANDSITIQVDEPTPLLNLLCSLNHAWSPDTGRIRCNEIDPWGALIFSPEQKSYKYIFQKNKKYKLFKGSAFLFEESFNVNESDSIFNIGDIFKIIVANDEEIWLFRKEPCNCPPSGHDSAYVERRMSSTPLP